MAEDHGSPEAGQLPKAWNRGRKEKRVAKERAAQRVRSWTVQDEMRGVLGSTIPSFNPSIHSSTLPTLDTFFCICQCFLKASQRKST